MKNNLQAKTRHDQKIDKLFVIKNKVKNNHKAFLKLFVINHTVDLKK